jgi:hypothetical protein
MPARPAAEVARVLAEMSYAGRIRAYRTGALSALAAAWFPGLMPLRNDEFEWIAIDAE